MVLQEQRNGRNVPVFNWRYLNKYKAISSINIITLYRYCLNGSLVVAKQPPQLVKSAVHHAAFH